MSNFGGLAFIGQGTKMLKTVFMSFVSVFIFNTSPAYITQKNSEKKLLRKSPIDQENMQVLITYLVHY